MAHSSLHDALPISTFALLGILYSLQQLTGQGKVPVLTLPVGD